MTVTSTRRTSARTPRGVVAMIIGALLAVGLTPIHAGAAPAPITGTVADFSGRSLAFVSVQLVESVAGSPGAVVDSDRTFVSGEFALQPPDADPYFLRVVPDVRQNGGFVRPGSFPSTDPTGRDVWVAGDAVDARVGLTYLAGRVVDSSTGQGVAGVTVSAEPPALGLSPVTATTGRFGVFVVRGLTGPLVDEEYTVCVDGTAVGYEEGQFQPLDGTVRGTTCADGLGASASAGWVGRILLDPTP